MFYRIENENADQYIVAVFNDDGSVATRIDANVYPIGSDTSARYEHPEGIRLTIQDARMAGIEEE